MKFSNELLSIIGEYEDLSVLDDDDPVTLSIRKRVEKELALMADIRVRDRHEKTRTMLKDVTKENLTPMMCIYLMNNGIASYEIEIQINARKTIFARWRREKNLQKRDMYMYYVIDIRTYEVVKKFRNKKSTAEYLGVSDSLINNSTSYERVLAEHYIIERDFANKPTLEEVRMFKYSDTYYYWQKNENNKRLKKIALRKGARK